MAVSIVADRGLTDAWRETGIPKPTLIRGSDVKSWPRALR